jgi:hypothetical protein
MPSISIVTELAQQCLQRRPTNLMLLQALQAHASVSQHLRLRGNAPSSCSATVLMQHCLQRRPTNLVLPQALQGYSAW